jgi:hypothetical protein
MPKDRTDRFLEGASYVLALVRVLRGEQPERVIEQTRTMVERARAVHTSINEHMGAAPDSARSPSSPSSDGQRTP